MQKRDPFRISVIRGLSKCTSTACIGEAGFAVSSTYFEYAKGNYLSRGGMIQQSTELRIVHLSRCVNGRSYRSTSMARLARRGFIKRDRFKREEELAGPLLDIINRTQDRTRIIQGYFINLSTAHPTLSPLKSP
jgi:hypothetical protein